MEGYDESMIRDILDQMYLNNSFVFLISKEFEKNGEEEVKDTEPIYKTKFSVRDLTETELGLLLTDATKDVPETELDLPEKNRFIPKDFEIFSDEKDSKKTMEDSTSIIKTEPKRIWDNSKSTLYHHQDDLFFVPKIYGMIKINCNCLNGHNDPKIRLLASLWSQLLNSYLKDITYLANCAYYNLGFYTAGTNLSISFSGYNDSTANILKETLIKLKEFFYHNDEKMFEDYRHKLETSIKNQLLGQAYTQGFLAHVEAKEANESNIKSKIAAIESLNYDDLKNFRKFWLRNIRMEHFIGGNYKEDDTQKLFTDFEDQFENLVNSLNKVSPANDFLNGDSTNADDQFEILPNLKFISKDDCNTRRALKLNEKTISVIELDNNNSNDRNSSIIVEFEVGPDPVYRSESLFLTRFLKEKYFTEMRTNKQLGYSVFTSCSTALEVRNIQFIIQGDVENSHYCAKITYDFIESLYEELRQMPKDKFDLIIQGIGSSYKEKYKTSMSRYSEDMYEVFNHRYLFNKKQIIGREVENLTLEKVVKAFEYIFFEKAAVLEIHVMSSILKEKSVLEKQNRLDASANTEKLDNQQVKIPRNIVCYESIQQLKGDSFLYPAANRFK